MGSVFEKPTRAKHPSLQKARPIPGNRRMCWEDGLSLALGTAGRQGALCPECGGLGVDLDVGSPVWTGQSASPLTCTEPCPHCVVKALALLSQHLDLPPDVMVFFL